MTEKVIHEFKLIETDDGFRLEVNGNKELLKRMGFGRGFGPMIGAMFGQGRGRFGRHHHKGHHGRRHHCHTQHKESGSEKAAEQEG